MRRADDGRGAIRLVLADVDGTLVTPDKELTDRAVAAVHRLHEAGIRFAVTSGRPPRGMAMLSEPLSLDTPIAAFNGGVIVQPDMTIVEQRTIPDDLVGPLVDLLRSSGLDVWAYRGADWYVTDPDAPHVEREAWTVRFEPAVVDTIESVSTDVAKLVGVSDDHDAVQRAAAAAHERFGHAVSASPSQPYYLDITHPEANKGSVARWLAATLRLAPEQIATIGDMPNDILMFEQSGLTIAMGNAEPEVKAAADVVTDGNDDDGFAKAMERFVLGRG